MARGFNLTAQINLRGPANIRAIVSDIQRQLNGITANVNLGINANTNRNIAQINNQLNTLNRNLQNTANIANGVTRALSSMGSALNAVNTATNNLPRNFSNLNNASRTTAQNFGSAANNARVLRTEMEEFGRQSALAVRRFAAYSVVIGTFYKLSNAINMSFKEFVNFDRELVRISQVTDTSIDNLRNLNAQITNLATTYGVASSALIQVSTTLAQAGLSAKETEQSLKALALSALAPSFDDMNETVEGSIALMRQFGIGAKELESALGSINAVSAKFAVEASDIIVAIQRTGGVFATASKGVSEGTQALNEFISVFTSIRATTRESAETIATGLRTIFARIQRAETIEQLKEFGVVLTDSENKFVGAYEAIRRLSAGLSTLDPRSLDFSKIVEELGGFRQIGKVIPLIQQFAVAQQALKVAQEGQGSLTLDAANAQQALAIQITKVKEEFNALIRSIGESRGFRDMVSLALNLASALIKVADASKNLLPAITALAAIKGTSALYQFSRGFMGGIRRQNAGGYITALAGGGMVPGIGNSDTVPAMLTPGEFVIRKKAVEKIGVERLAHMNKYAMGGPVKASRLKSSEVRKRVKSANSNIDEKEFQKGNYLTDSDSIIFDKYEYGVEAPKNIGWKAFETKVGKKVGGEPRGGNAPIDIPINKKRMPIEVRNRNQTTKDPELLDKLLRYKISRGQPLISNRKIKDNNLYAGKMGVAYNTGKIQRDRFTALNAGGQVQKFMAGTFVKSTSGRKKKERLVDITKADAERLPASAIITELSAPTIQAMLRESGIPLSANDLMRKRNLSDEERIVKSQVLDAYVVKVNGQATKNRGQNIQDTKVASGAGLLFGAVGMFGSPFAAANIQITKGLKKPTDVRVFGAVLDRNKAAREARLRQRTERLQKINTKREAKGKSEVKDIYALDIMGAPTALGLSRKYTREEVSASKKRANQRIINETEIALKQGLTGFFDFDDTSVVGRTAVPAGYREEKPVKGKPAKSPDYTLFGNTNAVRQGLKKARPTSLMKRLVKILKEAKKTDTNLYNSLLSRINILSARPDNTMKQVIGPWLKSQGLDLPGANVMGVGTVGLSAKGVAAAKTGSMLQKAPASSSFIVDDSSINTGDATSAGIRAYTYSPKMNLDRSTRKSLADIEGAKFENDLKLVLQEKAPLLYRAMSQQSETHRSIDFPYGLGHNIARGWFNNTLLSSIPVDAKRTLNGPRGAILENITNYLKTQGYASGGVVQGFAGGGKISRKVDFEEGVGPSPFGDSKRKLDYYSLQRTSTGLSPGEFDELVLFAKTNNLSLPQFKTYLDKRLATKRSRQGIRTDTSSLARSLMPEQRFAIGGSVEDTVPALLTPGEFVINKKAAKRIGAARLHQLNRADKIQGYNKGGAVQRFAGGGFLDSAISTMSERDSARIKASMNANAKAFEQLEKNVSGWPVEAVQAAMKKLARSIESGEKSFKFNPNTYNRNNPAERQDKKLRGDAALTRDSTSENRSSVSGTRFATGLERPPPPAERQLPGARPRPGPPRLEAVSTVGTPRTFTSFTGLRGENLTQKALTSKGTLDKSYLEKISQAVAKQLQDMGYTADITKKALLVFNTQVKQTGNAQNALSSATTAAEQAHRQAVNKNSFGGGGRPTGPGRVGSPPGGGPPGGGGGPPGGGDGPPEEDDDEDGPRRRRRRGRGRKRKRKRERGEEGMGSMAMGMGVMMASSAAGMVAQNSTGKTKAAAEGASVGLGMMSAGMMMGPVGAVVGGLAGLVTGIDAYNSSLRKEQEDLANTKISAGVDNFNKSLDALSKNIHDASATMKAINQLQEIGKQEKVKENVIIQEEGRTWTEYAGGVAGKQLFRTAALLGMPTGEGGYDPYKARQAKNSESRAAKMAEANKTGAESAAKQLNAYVEAGFSVDKIMETSGGKQILQQMAEGDINYQNDMSQITDAKVRAQNYKEQQEAAAGGDEAGMQKAARIYAATMADLDNQAAQLTQKHKEQILAAAKAREAELAKIKAIEAATHATKELVVSFQQTINGIEQSTAVSLAGMDSINRNISDASTGTVSSLTNDRARTALENPLAVSDAERNSALNRASFGLGASAEPMRNLANFSVTGRQSIVKAAVDAKKSGSRDPQAIGNSIEKAIGSQIENAFGKGAASDTIMSEVRQKISKMIEDKGGKDLTDSDIQGLIDGVDGLQGMFETADKAMAAFVSRLQILDKQTAMYIAAVEKTIEIQEEAMSRQSNAVMTLGDVDNKVKTMLGKRLSLSEMGKPRLQAAATRLGINAQNYNTNDLTKLRETLIRQRAEVVDQRDRARKLNNNRGEIEAEGRLVQFNNAIKKSEQAIMDLPESIKGSMDDTMELLGDAVARFSAKQQKSEGMLSTVVTSTPEQVMQLNQNFNMMNRALTGNLESIYNNIGANEAYYRTLQQGGNWMEATQAAQASYAQQLQGALQMFDDMAELQGIDKPERNQMKANMLENMAMVQGYMSPMMAQMIKNLRRSPEDDPETKRILAVLEQQKATFIQAEEAAQNILLNRQADVMQQAYKPLIDVLNTTAQSFENTVKTFERLGLTRILGPVTPARGGLIYASQGTLVNYEPKGTDTVPAMLTPGEFVVNARATAQHLPLLKAINSGSDAMVSQTMSKGGVVYAQNGGPANPPPGRPGHMDAPPMPIITSLKLIGSNLFSKLFKYTSGSKGTQKLKRDIDESGSSLKVSQSSNVSDGYRETGSYNPNTNTVTYNKDLISMGLMEHEFLHAVQKTSKNWDNQQIKSIVANYVGNPNGWPFLEQMYNLRGMKLFYSSQDLKNTPVELLPNMIQYHGDVMNSGNSKAIGLYEDTARKIMKAYGYESGGLVVQSRRSAISDLMNKSIWDDIKWADTYKGSGKNSIDFVENTTGGMTPIEDIAYKPEDNVPLLKKYTKLEPIPKKYQKYHRYIKGQILLNRLAGILKKTPNYDEDGSYGLLNQLFGMLQIEMNKEKNKEPPYHRGKDSVVQDIIRNERRIDAIMLDEKMDRSAKQDSINRILQPIANRIEYLDNVALKNIYRFSDNIYNLPTDSLEGQINKGTAYKWLSKREDDVRQESQQLRTFLKRKQPIFSPQQTSAQDGMVAFYSSGSQEPVSQEDAKKTHQANEEERTWLREERKRNYLRRQELANPHSKASKEARLKETLDQHPWLKAPVERRREIQEQERQEKERQKKAKTSQKPKNNPVGIDLFASGGSVYDRNSSDTVPAMLTPGEFVINQKSAKKYDGLLHKINNDQPIYAKEGGSISRNLRLENNSSLVKVDQTNNVITLRILSDIPTNNQSIDQNKGVLNTDLINVLVTKFDGFMRSLQSLNLPTRFEHNHQHDIRINFNGSEVFSTLMREDGVLAKWLVSRIDEKFAQLTRNTDGAL